MEKLECDVSQVEIADNRSGGQSEVCTRQMGCSQMEYLHGSLFQ
jgi:hypothetical protein